MVYWITGLAGAGKTTIGRALYANLKEAGLSCVYLDGDLLREVFGGDLGYSENDRRTSAMRNARLCRLLAAQDIHVVCATISMFRDVREWNRQNIPGYCEVFLDVSFEVLRRRDQKGLYSGAEAGTEDKVSGIQVRAELPERPDLTVVNDGRESPASIAVRILECWPVER